LNVDPLVELEAIKVYFYVRRGLFGSTEIKALEEVSLTLSRGETVAVVGESGSGKTTLGRATLRLLPLAGGRILFAGEDITGLDGDRLKAFRRRVQAVFQDPYASLSPYMRVYELVEEALLIHGPSSRQEREGKVLEALDRVRLRPAREVAEKYPHTLSGGQRQRVSIARAMVLEPEYIVADEPVSMIDASSRAEILYLLRELQGAKGLTFLYITHDLASARHFADRIAVMYLGRIVELASSAALIEDPLHPYTQALLKAVPEPDPKNRLQLRQVVAGEPPSPAKVPSGCPFHPRCPKAIKGICDIMNPPLEEVSPGHWVACHLYQAVGEPTGAFASHD
jgi:peptide/nickel transport system ATP-binding protein